MFFRRGQGKAGSTRLNIYSAKASTSYPYQNFPFPLSKPYSLAFDWFAVQRMCRFFPDTKPRQQPSSQALLAPRDESEGTLVTRLSLWWDTGKIRQLIGLSSTGRSSSRNKSYIISFGLESEILMRRLEKR